VEFFLQGAEGLVTPLVVFLAPVAEIKPENVGPGIEKIGNHLLGGRSRPEGGNDFGASFPSHDTPTIRTGPNFSSVYKGIGLIGAGRPEIFRPRRGRHRFFFDA